MTTPSSILAWKSHGQRSLLGYNPWGGKRVRYDLATKQQQTEKIAQVIFFSKALSVPSQSGK